MTLADSQAVAAGARRALPVALSAVVLTLNEESNLDACLGSLAGWTDSIFVVDSGSTDGTAEIAARWGAVLLHHSFESHTEQWRWALANLPFSSQWVLALDADQRITPELRDELARLFGEDTETLRRLDGIYINRRQIFRGRWIRHGGYYPKYLLKLFRRDKVVFDELDLVDHHFYVAGPTRKMRFDLIEQNLKEDSIAFWIEKHNRYARKLAEEDFRRAARASHPLAASAFGSPDQKSLWQKSIWSRLPLYLRSFAYFFYRYFLKLGFLDGKQGFIFHFLHAFWFRLLIDINIDEIGSRKSTGE